VKEGDVIIERIERSTFIKFMIYYDNINRAAKDYAFIYLSNFTFVLAIDKYASDTSTKSEIEFRLNGDSKMSIYLNKVVVLKPLEVQEGIICQSLVCNGAISATSMNVSTINATTINGTTINGGTLNLTANIVTPDNINCGSLNTSGISANVSIFAGLNMNASQDVKAGREVSGLYMNAPNAGFLKLIVGTNYNPSTISLGNVNLLVGGTKRTSGVVTRSFTFNTGISTTSQTLTDTVIMAQGSIHSSGWFGASSDERIKRDIVDLDDEECLTKLLLLKPRTYKYRDLEKGNEIVVGFIAQEVYDVMGNEAVKLGTEFIYDINAKAKIENNIITFDGTLELNTSYKSYHLTDDKDAYFKIGEKISENQYKIIGEIPNGDLFIIGKQVDDFHILNKTAIFTYNVSATQEIHRMIIRQQTVIDSLISRIEALEA
jgi:hypothetical protein